MPVTWRSNYGVRAPCVRWMASLWSGPRWVVAPPFGARNIRHETGSAVPFVVGPDRLSLVIGSFSAHLTVETTAVSDRGNTLVVLLVTLFLVSAGVALTAVAVWYWRSTVPDPESLGPLHSMSTRKYADLDVVEQRRALDSSRPSLVATVATEVAEPSDVADGEAVEDPVGERTTIESVVVDDDDIWPGDDWSDLDALQSDEPEILVDVFDERPRVEPETRSRPAPIDPLIT